MTTLEIRNVDPEVLRGYLVAELGGEPRPDGSVRGQGWRATFLRLPDAPVGALTVPAVEVRFAGEGSGDAAAFLARRAMRGGG